MSKLLLLIAFAVLLSAISMQSVFCQTARVDTIVMKSGKRILATSVQDLRGKYIWYSYPNGPLDSAQKKNAKLIQGKDIPPVPDHTEVTSIYVAPPPAQPTSIWRLLLLDFSIGLNGWKYVGGAGITFKAIDEDKFALNANISWKNRQGKDETKGRINNVDSFVTIPATRENDIALGIELQVRPFHFPLYFYASPSFVYDITDSTDALAGKIGIGYEPWDPWNGSINLSYEYFKTAEVHNSVELEVSDTAVMNEV